MAAGVVIAVMTYFPIIFVLSNSLKSGKGIFTPSERDVSKQRGNQ